MMPEGLPKWPFRGPRVHLKGVQNGLFGPQNPGFGALFGGFGWKLGEFEVQNRSCGAGHGASSGPPTRQMTPPLAGLSSRQTRLWKSVDVGGKGVRGRLWGGHVCFGPLFALLGTFSGLFPDFFRTFGHPR